MAVPAAVLSILVQANTGGATRGLMRFNQQLGGTEAKSNKATRALGTFAKVGIAGSAIGLGFAVKKAADFEEQLDSLGSVSGATGRQMERFRKQAMKAGADTKFSALDAAEAQTELAKGGLKVRQIMRGGLRSALALAAAGEMDLAEAAATTANALNLFGLEGKSSMKVADALAKAANATTADVTDFAMALRQSGGVAKTAGLSFSETVLALEALANAGTKNSDAGTSLKTALIQLIKPTEKQLGLANKLNLEFLDAGGNFKNLADVSSMLRDRLGGMTAAQRTATLATLAGTDGVRTLTALYDAGPSKLEKWKKGLNESGTAAEVAARKQSNLKGRLENLQGSVETIAIAVGMKLIPSLTKYAEKLTSILNDTKLSGSEKVGKVSQLLAEAIGKGIGAAGAAAAKAAPHVAWAFVKAFMEADAWGKLAIGGAGAFLLKKLGLGSGIGRLLGRGGGLDGGGGGGILKSAKPVPVFVTNPGFGGGGGKGPGTVVGKVGDALKGGTALSVAAKAVPVISAGTIIAYIATKNNRNLPTGSGSGQGTRSRSVEDMARGRAPVAPRDAFRRQIGTQIVPSKGIKDEALAAAAVGAERLGKRIRAARQEINAMRAGSGADIDALATKAKRQFRNIEDSIGLHTRKGRQVASENFEAAATNIARSMAKGRTSSEKGMSAIRGLMRTHSKAGKEALTRNLVDAANNIRQSMRSGEISTKRGMQIIERLMVQALQGMGFTKEQALDARRSKKSGSKTAPGLPGTGALPHQRGGPIMEGALSGDSVPSVLERGEYVLNRNAVRKVGRKALDTINFAQAPRFATGGWVGDDPSGLNSAVKSMSLWAMRKYGASASDTLRPAGTLTSSGNVSDHTTGAAVDLVSPNMLEMAKGLVRSFQPKIKQLIHTPLGYSINNGAKVAPFAQEDHYDHVHIAALGKAVAAIAAMAPKLAQVVVSGPDSPLKSLTQEAINLTHAAAQSKLNDAAASSAVDGSGHGNLGGITGGGSSNENIALGRRMAKRFGWTGSQFGALIELWNRESGWSQSAHNPSSGAHGIPQSLPASKMASEGADYMTNPVTQIAWGLKYIQDRYGSPSAALSFHDSHNWYKKGGVVEGFQSGGGVESKWGQSINAKEMPSFMKAIWGQARGLGFAGPMPKFMRGKLQNKGAYGEWDPASNAIHMSKKALGALGNAQAPNRDYALNTLLHEMAHSQQVELPKREMEGGADVWAHWAANKIFPALGIDQTSMPPYGYPAFASWVTKNKPERWWQKGQFGLKKGGMIDKLAYAGDSLGVGTLGAGLKGKLGKIDLASKVKGGEPSSWGVGALKGLMGKGVGAAMLDMGTNDGTAANLRPSISAVENMLGNKPLMMASLDPQSTDAAKKNAAIRANADVVIPWADIAQKYASDKVHPTGAGYSKRASLIAQAAKKLTADGEGSGLTEAEKKQLKTPLKGSVGKVLTKTLKVLRSGKPAKFRGTRLKQLEKRIKGMDVGLPEGMRKQITNLRAGVEEYGEYADRASSLSVDNEDGTTSLGVIKGKTEAGWVTDQLDMLFKLRERLVDAKKIVEKHRAEVQKLIERMQKRLQALAEDIRTAAKAKREAEQHLKQLQKHPKQNREKIKKQKALIERIEGNQSDRGRERDAISDKILPALTGKRKQFTTFINENIMGSDGLPQIQGLGSPLEKLKVLPPVGVLGGDIFDAQIRLRELAAPSTSITDSATPETSESAELLKQLLDEANLRTAVSQKQYEVLRNMPPYGGQFATGGVVPGPIGAARTIVAHGGETVTPSGNGSAPVVQLNFASGMEWLDKYIEVKVDGVTRKQARAGARGLPGRGGGF